MQRLSALILALALSSPPAARAADIPGADPAAKGKASPEAEELERLTTENRLQKARLESKLKDVAAQLEELKTRYEVESHQQRLARMALESELAQLQMASALAKQKAADKLQAQLEEKDDLLVKNQLEAEKRKAELAAVEAEKNRLAAELALGEEKHKSALAALRRERERLGEENSIQKEKLEALQLQLAKEKEAMEMDSKRLGLQAQKLKFQETELESRLAKVNSDLKLRGQEEEWRKEANRLPDYTLNPYDPKAGRLTISDRRVALNGPIFSGVADYVTERIHYFNNVSDTQPIFIVIDRCPGGSVMEGYRIVKAIEASRAPIHVVVKQYAASMAAVITTLADRSYAYPNAIILHHEMSTIQWGNMTQLKEQLEIAREWERRLHGPVSKKIGMPIDEFRKKMYEHNSDGDWEEFADSAKKLGWVANIVHEIRETGMTKNPDRVQKRDSGLYAMKEERDEKGLPFVRLPRLSPYDLYHIHNPDNYYR